MLNKIDAINKLTEEKGYEDSLITDLEKDYLPKLNAMQDILPERKIILVNYLNKMVHDAGRHSFMLDQLIKKIMENDRSSY